MARNVETDKSKLPGTFPGHHYWKAIQGSVNAILAPLGIRRRVVSKGSRFLNHDAWTGHAFTEFLNQKMAEHPDRPPSQRELKEVVRRANAIECSDPYIQVARMPDRVSHRVALAIIGGGYHEAWHTKYSKRGRLQMDEVVEIVNLIREVTDAGGRFDEKVRGLLMTLHHLVEDIRIERCGNRDFPGAAQPMRDLQDFVLDQEAKARKGSGSNARSVLLCAFRDLGLGYNTHKAREALEYYKRESPDSIALLASEGPLAPLLREAIELEARDQMGALRVAMKIVVTLWKASQRGAEPKLPLKCPECGAPPKELTFRPAQDKDGAKIRGLVEMECRSCGFKNQLAVPDQSLDLHQNPNEDDDSEDDGPEMEGFTQNDVNGRDGFGYDEREHARNKDVLEEKENAAVTCSAPGGRLDIGEDVSDEGVSGEGVLSSVLSTQGEGVARNEEEEEERQSIPPGRGAGGDNTDLGRDPDSFLKSAQDILGADGVTQHLNNLEALEDAMGAAMGDELRDTRSGEMLWNPEDPSLDEARIVRSQHQAMDQDTANQMLSEVREVVVFLRSRLRVIVRAQEMTDITHGVRRGRKLSSRTLVDTAIDLKTGKEPKRAFQIEDVKPDTSVALALCLDQSGSMSAQVRSVAQCMMVMADSMESVGGKTMAFGFRDGESVYGSRDENETKGAVPHHRVCGVRYDVFKTFEEKFASTKWRFAHTQATGTTPMADGVQFGLAALNPRSEGHRILCVITDGYPNSPHDRVIARQIRIAGEAGIHVLGVGIGSGAQYVQNLFPDHVWAPKVQELATPLLKKLNELCDFQGRRRGRKANLDGKVTQKVS